MTSVYDRPVPVEHPRGGSLVEREDLGEGTARPKPRIDPPATGSAGNLWRRKGCLAAIAAVSFFALVGLVLLLTRGDGDQTAVVAPSSTTTEAATTTLPTATTAAATTVVVTLTEPAAGPVASEPDEVAAIVRFIHEAGTRAEPGFGATYDNDTVQIVDDRVPEELAQLEVFFAKLDGNPWVMVGKPGAQLKLDDLYAEGDGYADSTQVPGVDLVPAGREPLPWFSPRLYPDPALEGSAAGVSYLLFSLGVAPALEIEELGLFLYVVGEDTFQALEWRVRASLRDIPIIGNPFQMDRTVRVDSELILVLTPKIVAGGE